MSPACEQALLLLIITGQSRLPRVADGAAV